MRPKTEKDAPVRLPYFGLNRLLPFLRPYRKQLTVMILLGIVGSAADIIFPLFQRYAIDHYIAEAVLDTLPVFIGRVRMLILSFARRWGRSSEQGTV